MFIKKFLSKNKTAGMINRPFLWYSLPYSANEVFSERLTDTFWPTTWVFLSWKPRQNMKKRLQNAEGEEKVQRSSLLCLLGLEFKHEQDVFLYHRCAFGCEWNWYSWERSAIKTGFQRLGEMVHGKKNADTKKLLNCDDHCHFFYLQ